MASKRGNGSKGDDTKSKTLGLRPTKANKFVWALSDPYIENLSKHILYEQKLEKLQTEYQKQQNRYKEHEKDVDLVRFAFLLLKKELGVAELDRINPLLVHAFSRAALTDGFAYNNGQNVHKYAKAVLNHEVPAIKPPMPEFNKMLATNQNLIMQERNRIQREQTNNNNKQTYLFKLFNQNSRMNNEFFRKKQEAQENIQSQKPKNISILKNPFQTRPIPPQR